MQLSPEYGLSLIRLAHTPDADADEVMSWPGLLLHSPNLTWAFDPAARQLEDLDDVRGLAAAAGLHQVTDPFGGDLPAATQPWTFRLPTMLHPAQLAAPGMAVDISRAPAITPAWWNMAVTHGGQCRLLVAACVQFPPHPGQAAHTLIEAAAGQLVYGATIKVQF